MEDVIAPLAHHRPAQPSYAPSRRVVIFSDFDGTISSKDSLKILFNQFADSKWPEIERAMTSGEMPESIGLQRSFDSLKLSFESALKYVLKNVKIDSGFRKFAKWIQSEGHELSILSGGLTNFIKPLLKREGLGGLRLLANEAKISGDAWTIQSCPVERLCENCNHCKSASLLKEIQKDPNVFLVYIGDGVTDTCAIQLADLVYAKGFLVSYCAEREIPFVEFRSFSNLNGDLALRLAGDRPSVAA